MTDPVLVWFRDDLRLTDNPALEAAAATGRPLVALYVIDSDPCDPWPMGLARRWWHAQSVVQVGDALRAHGVPLVVREGRSAIVLRTLAREIGATAAFWNRSWQPFGGAVDAAAGDALARDGVDSALFNASLLFEPGSILSRDGAPYRVFSAFWRACRSAPPPAKPRPAPRRLTGYSGRLPDASRVVAPVQMAAGARWSEAWTPGEQAARERLDDWLVVALGDYDRARDSLNPPGTSRLSPHLAAGELGPRQVWHAVQASAGAAPADKFLAELGWREFAAHQLFHFASLTDTPMRTEFARFPARDDPAALAAWQAGATGYPVVDAAMRDLKVFGTMPNRARMVVASFLTKHLLLPWQDGARWFWQRLVDADLASNSVNWQWVAGTGIDLAPFFRIFNPVLQGQRFDAQGDYVRRHVPELARLPARWIHEPWRADAATLAAAGVEPGVDYPEPIVVHRTARARALAAFATIQAPAG